MPGNPILLEQVVYGSFPFWDRGYDVLARSPRVRDDWLTELLAACRRYGEAPHGATAAPALFSLRLAQGPRAVVGVFPQGLDDRGRPGALAFHAVLVADRDFRRAGADPFAFARALRGDWTAETSALPSLPWRPEAADSTDIPASDPRVPRIVAALAGGRRVALEADAPIEAMARQVWALLPEPARRRASVATWAFGNDNRFDLVALPRLAGVSLDASYLLPGALDEPEPSAPAAAVPAKAPIAGRRRPRWPVSAGAIAAAVLVAVVAFRQRAERPAPGLDAGAAHDLAVPPLDPPARARALAALDELAGRFGVAASAPASEDPAGLMGRFSAQVRYRGPTLSPAELARLAAEPGPDGGRALAWHDRLRRFADDRPLPGSFRRLSLEQQLGSLAWSFHLPPPVGVEEIPAALDDALSRDGPVTPTPLAAKYPALSDYARFLMHLPRRNDGGRP